MRSPQEILEQSKTIAVVGLSDDPTRYSHHVAQYLQTQGYRIIPVNPTVKEVLGERSYPVLRAIPEPVDVVEVFRRSDAVLPIAQEAIAIKAKALWLQDGVINEEAAKLAREAGLDVVMNDCMLRQHRRLRSSGAL